VKMGTLWELWAEISHESESLADPILLECLQAGKTHRIFDEIVSMEKRNMVVFCNIVMFII